MTKSAETGLLPSTLADPDASVLFSPAGRHPVVFVDLSAERAAEHRCRPVPPAAILIGIDKIGAVPDGLGQTFDILLTTARHPPREWVSVSEAQMDTKIAELRSVSSANPFAASIFVQVLRLGTKLGFQDALILESLGYSTLLAGSDFRHWRQMNPPRLRNADKSPLTFVRRDDDNLRITLNRPQAHNALNAQMRDELVNALQVAVADPSIRHIVLDGNGPSFSSGGDVDEFGTAQDQGLAHAVRIGRSVAGLIHRCANRITVRLHGACLGAGIEISAAAGHVIADATIRAGLPEVSMGLIPGAGGTVTLPRRIGRHRTCYLGLSGTRLTLGQALDWGLVDEQS